MTVRRADGKRPVIAWVGWMFFWHGMVGEGFKPRSVPLEAGETLTYEDIARRCGEEPDMVLYLDRSLPPPLIGLESFPCPTCFYCVDSHIHSWYPAYAQAFDLCAVSLRGHMPRFLGRLDEERIFWLPPSMKEPEKTPPAPESAKEQDLLFVGNVNPETMPGRVRFLAEVKERLPGLVVTQGDYRALFPTARLVLNIAERGDLNFRVVEALGTGSCLVTPEVGHGLTDLFTPGEHLFTYPPGDADALAALVAKLLPDVARRERVARAGHARVVERHSHMARGRDFGRWLFAQPLDDLVARRLAARRSIHGEFLRPLYLHWAEVLSGTPLAARYLTAAKARPA